MIYIYTDFLNHFVARTILNMNIPKKTLHTNEIKTRVQHYKNRIIFFEQLLEKYKDTPEEERYLKALRRSHKYYVYFLELL